MEIRIENGMAKVFTPYNKDFVEKVKGIGGRKWDAASKCWMIPETEVEVVREYMMEVFGETDIPTAEEKVAVKVTFTDDAVAKCGSVVLFGKTIARAFGRDSGAKVGEDVTLISGAVGSGGSARNWTTVIEAGTVVKARNVSRTALTRETEYSVEVEEIKEAGIDRAALEEEKEKLIARLAEIERLLKQ